MGKERKVFLPMIRVCPVVSFLKRFRSSDMCHSRRLSFPMARFSAMATMMEILCLIEASMSDGYGTLDVRVRIVIFDVKVLEAKIKD